MATYSGDFFGPASPANAVAVLTLVFSIGQGVGPVIAGFLAERSGGFRASYGGAGSAAFLALGPTLMLSAPQTIE